MNTDLIATSGALGNLAAEVAPITRHVQGIRMDEGMPELPTKMSARKLNVFYGENQALFDVDLDVPEGGSNGARGQGHRREPPG